MKTTTTKQLKQLRDESAKAGDLSMYAICVDALLGDEDAIDECARVIAEAEAMDDGE